MSRSLAFYQAAERRQDELVGMLATDYLKTQMQEWHHNGASDLSDLMQLHYITGVRFPASVSEPVFFESNPNRLTVSLGLDEKMSATVELVKSSDGTILIDAFRLIAAGTSELEAWERNTLGNLGYGPDEIKALSQERLKSIFAPGATLDGAPAFMPDDAQRSDLLAHGITGAQSDVLGNLGYTYEEMLALTRDEFDFIFPNAELWDKLKAKGYDAKRLRRPFALEEAGYHSFKALIREALAR